MRSLVPTRSTTLRYACVGIAVAAIYWVLANLGSLVLPLPLWVVSAIAYTLAVVAQYVLHAKFTFRGTAADFGQGIRFAVSIGLGYLVSTLVTAWFAPAAGLSDIVATSIVVVLVPLLNLFMISTWVFRRD